MNYTHITHESIPIFIDDNSAVLILGSLPSVKTREVGFYYGHPRNRFFKVLSSIFNIEEPITIEDKKELLEEHNIALYDVIYECDNPENLLDFVQILSEKLVRVSRCFSKKKEINLVANLVPDNMHYIIK